jgi:hypothetical protein
VLEAAHKDARLAEAAEDVLRGLCQAEQKRPAGDGHACVAQHRIEARHGFGEPLLRGLEPAAVGKRAPPDVDGRSDRR